MGFKKREQDSPVDRGERIVPINSTNEQRLLSFAIQENRCLEILLTRCNKEDFLFVNHQALFECLKFLYDQSQEISIETIDAIKDRFEYGMKLNAPYIIKLLEVFRGKIEETTFEFHIEILKADKIRDALQVSLIPELSKIIANPQTTVNEMIESLQSIISKVDEHCTSSDFRFIHSSEVNEKHNEEIKNRELGGVFGKTGYKKLDAILTDGFSPKKITIIAARPGGCKSSLVANIFLRLGMCGIPTAIYNFEMDEVSMFDRMVSIHSNIPLTKIIKDRGSLTEAEKLRELETKTLISKLPIYFYTASTNTLQGVRRELQILRDKYGVRLVAYDLFKKMKMSSRRNGSTADMLSENLDEIQAMGKDFGIHQILVVQIGRSAEKRNDKRPKLSELKDSGGFEEVADNVLLLYRDAYYQDAEEEIVADEFTNHELEIIVAKQRQGTQNQKVILDFFPASTAIAEPIMRETK